MSWDTASSGAHVVYLVLVEVLTDPAVRVFNGIGQMAFSGASWSGVSVMGGISAFGGGDLDASEITLTLGGVPTDERPDLINADLRGREVNVYHGFWDAGSGTFAHAPELLWSGFASHAAITEAAENEGEATLAVEVTCLSAGAYVRRQTRQYRTDAAQQSLFPGDLFYSFKATGAGDAAATTGGAGFTDIPYIGGGGPGVGQTLAVLV